jgi:hypothetical protein
MKNTLNRLAAALLTTAMLATAPASLTAHHGAAAFGPATVTLETATVTGFDWRNPHALLRFTATAADGTAAEWTAETAGLVILLRAGWRRDVLKPGDQVTIVGRPASNGSHTMLLQRIILSDGRELSSFVPPK